jgi:hypothetical protein
MAIESVSSIAYVPPFSRTQYSRRASIRRAPPVISEASGGRNTHPAHPDARLDT